MKKLLLALCLFTFTAKAQDVIATIVADSGNTLKLASSISSTVVRYGQLVFKDTMPNLYFNTTDLTLASIKGGGDGSEEHPDTTYIYNHFEFVREHAWQEATAKLKADDLYRAAYWTGVCDGMRAVLHADYTGTQNTKSDDEQSAFAFKFTTEYPLKPIKHISTKTKKKVK